MAAPLIGGTGIGFSTPPQEITLGGAQAMLVPAGQYVVMLGPYSILEFLDPNTSLWRNTYAAPGSEFGFTSDGANFRLINRTGCPVGAIVTNKGSGYTSAPTVTSSAGGSLWKAVVGGAFNTTVTTTTAGAYNYPPTIIFPPPPAGGITATATVALSGAGLGTVTMVNRGAGYTVVPTSVAVNNSGAVPYNPQSPNIQIVQDPRDTAAGGGVITMNAAFVDAQAVTAVLCTDPGTAAVTSLPTLTFAGGGGTNAAATVIMNWTVTGITVGTPGTGYGNALPFKVIANNMLNTSTDFAGDVNPAYNLGLTQPRNCSLAGTSTAGGAATATGLVIEDAGWGIQRVPELIILTGQLITGAAAATASVGATADTSYLQLQKL